MTNPIIDLDDLVPRSFFDVSPRNFFPKKTGTYNTKSLKDWRRLERRSYETHSAWDPKNSAWWGGMKELLSFGKKQGAEKVWVIHPHQSTERYSQVMEFDGALRFFWPEDRIEAHINKPRKTSLIIKGKQAKEIYETYYRCGDMRRRHAVIKQAFIDAVSVRLNEFVRLRQVSAGGVYYMQDSSFIIENEGRSYTFTYTYRQGTTLVADHNHTYMCT